MGRAISVLPLCACSGISHGDIYLYFYLDIEVRKTKNYASQSSWCSGQHPNRITTEHKSESTSFGEWLT